jgi:outer membrane immunogenic protein
MLSRLQHRSICDKGRLMRCFVLLLCLFGLSSHAVAADLDWPLRGAEPPTAVGPQWEGFYVGGQVGYGIGHLDLSGAFNSTNIFNPNNGFTAPLGQVSSWASTGVNFPSTVSYGGFLGYNSIWEEAMLGVELAYNHFGLRGSESSSRCYSDTNAQCTSPSIVMGDSNSYDVNVTATAEARITDYATLRGRGGWAYGNIMPYAVAGMAVGRVETTRTAIAIGIVS